MFEQADGGFLGNWSSQARKGVLELIVMSVLAKREFYGYGLVEHIKALGGLEVTDGTLYAILARLQKEGFITHRWVQPEKGPGRKYYALTGEGRAALKAMQAIWRSMAASVAAAGRCDD